MQGSRLGDKLVVLLLAALAAACASTGNVPRPYPGAPAPPKADAAPVPARVVPPSATAETVVSFARTLLGVPYRDGGADPAGFDCSGFVQYVFAQAGVALPRSVREQWQAGTAVDRQAVEPGDLLFFRTSGDEVTHVAIALDGETFVHAPSARGVVRVEGFGAAYWVKRYAGARRIE